MSGLLGRKLGMTQVFDAEDGHVERVTVLEAGPCFVTAIRRADRDGYDAVQLAFGAAREKLQGRGGHLRKAGVGPLGHLCEFEATPPRSPARATLELGRELRVDAVFERGQTVKVAGSRRARAFRGPSSATTSTAVTHGSHNVRAPGRSARPPTPRGCSRASAAPVRWATSA